ncbi:MAG TPA: hypothetical protein VNQ90_00905 [Chthoniobacteraceae bacterium]|nr:hypothetical protein [Chthoniobacteraceae bacterium]
MLSELHQFFRPELIGWFDEKIVFRPLSPETQREIGRLVVWEELERFKKKGFDLAVSDSAFEFLIRRGIHKTLGARPMRKAVQKFIGDAIREALKRKMARIERIDVSPSGNCLVASRNLL